MKFHLFSFSTIPYFVQLFLSRMEEKDGLYLKGNSCNTPLKVDQGLFMLRLSARILTMQENELSTKQHEINIAIFRVVSCCLVDRAFSVENE